jgi:hypothetical protein
MAEVFAQVKQQLPASLSTLPLTGRVALNVENLGSILGLKVEGGVG